MLRVMAKCLVNFQSIDVSMRYVDEQVPQIALKYVRRFMHSSPATDTKKSKTVWWKSFVDISTVAQVICDVFTRFMKYFLALQ